MSDLQNQTPADTYKGLLQVGDYTNGVDANSEYIQDGEGTNSALSISTTKVGVGTVSPSAELDVNGNVIADEYALDGTGASTSAVAIHAPAANELAIRTNSSEQVRIDSSGDIILSGLTSASQGTKAKIVHTSGTGANGEDSKNDGGLILQSSDNGTYVNGLTIDHSGKVGIGTISPAAPLEISSTGGGVILPRMTTTQRDAISSPSDGMMIYNTTTNKFQGRANNAWVDFH